MMRSYQRIATVFVLGGVIGMVSCKKDDDAIIRTSDEDGKTTITIDRQKLKEETQEAADAAERAGRRALDETGEALQEAGKALEAEGNDGRAPDEP